MDLPRSIIQDGVVIDGAELERRATRLAEGLRLARASRAALLSPRAVSVLTAIYAAEIAGCEILLMRRAYAQSDEIWQALKVDILIGDDGTLDRPTVPAQRRRTEFAVLLTTSGTTGAPKVARHSLDRLCGRIGRPVAGREPARWLLCYHPSSFAGLQVLLTCAIGRGDLVAVSEPTIARLTAVALECLPTHASATPTLWRSMIWYLGEAARRIPLRQITLGGEIVGQSTLDLVRSAFPQASITHIYASTEAGAVFAVKDGLEGFPAGWLEGEHDGVTLRIRNNALEVKSRRAMHGYVGTAPGSPIVDKGWIVTNDLVELRGNRVHFIGRADSTIIVGGAKVAPEEIEAVLLGIPGIVDARVYPKPNPITGAIIAADITLSDRLPVDGARKMILEHARKYLESYKVPRIISFISEVEVSETGKKQRS